MMRLRYSPMPGLWLVCALVASSVFAAEETPPDKRPNILFCLADDWAWPHAGAYGDKVVRTPTFDRVAREGVLFRNAFVAAPTCTASRGGILTGQAIHRLEEGGNLWSILPNKFKVYPDLLEASGYAVGLTRKGWGPGTLEGTGRTRNPAGPAFKSFAEFFKSVPTDKPFCFWFGGFDPHRPYEPGSGKASGMKTEDVSVPPYLPDTPAVRSDLLDYYFEVQRFDREVGEMLELLAKAGRLDNTIVVMTGDNGIPFPRAKASLYEAGTHAPLAIRWPAQTPGARTVDDFVSLIDLCPTLLDAAGLKPLPEMTGRSFLDVLRSNKSGQVDPRRDHVFTERERHVPCRPDAKSYPCRALRTAEFLYIRNLRPELAPYGDDNDYPNSIGPFGDADGSPTKTELLNRRTEPQFVSSFQLCFGLRPAEELYLVKDDPWDLHNVAGKPEYAQVQAKLRAQMNQWMHETADPRALGETDFWDKCPYVAPARKPAKKGK